MEIADLNPGSPRPPRSTAGTHLPVSSLSPSLVELGCEEDMLDDDDSTCDEETQVMPQAPPTPSAETQPQLSPPQIQASLQSQLDSFEKQPQLPISPDDVCLQPPMSLNLYNAALVTCSPGEGLTASTVATCTPEISPGFPHFILSCQDFTTGIFYDTVSPLSPSSSMGEAYLTDTHSNGPPGLY